MHDSKNSVQKRKSRSIKNTTQSASAIALAIVICATYGATFCATGALFGATGMGTAYAAAETYNEMGAADTSDDKTFAPYFVVIGESAFPLKDTIVTANLNGVVADVFVNQIYVNDGNAPINAKYVFPASTGAAVRGMKMKIGDEVITARIKEREEAKTEFIQAKREGKSASLLERQRPNVFTMEVANIMPGDVVVIELHYSEMLTPIDGVYQFVFPTVVGPRYSGGTVIETTPSEASSGIAAKLLSIRQSVTARLLTNQQPALFKPADDQKFILTQPSADQQPVTAPRLSDMSARVLTDISISFDGLDAYDISGPCPAALFASKPIVMFGKWRGDPSGTVRISGRNGNRGFLYEIDAREAFARGENEKAGVNGALDYLWARARLDTLTGYGLSGGVEQDAARREITDIGLKYSLLTPYTSFIAISEIIRNPSGEAADVNQPLPLPSVLFGRTISDSRVLHADFFIFASIQDEGSGVSLEWRLLRGFIFIYCAY